MNLFFRYLITFAIYIQIIHPYPLCAIEQKKTKIAVVGAGLAGLTTAYRLHQKGYDVEVYEARPRVGGRVFTVKVCGSLAEMGGLNILDGGAATNILGLIDELGLETERFTQLLEVHYYDGNTIRSISNIIAASDFVVNISKARLLEAAEQASSMKDVLDILFKDDIALYTALYVWLAGYEGSVPEKLSTVYIETLYHMLSSGLSSTHPGRKEKIPTIDFLYVKGGNALIAETLAQKLMGKVHLNSPLKAIAKTASGSYQLHFENQQSIQADIVVLTTPCTVYADIAFEKRVISPNRLAAIQSVQYGTNSRILTPIASSNTDQKVYTNGRIVAFFNRNEKVLNCHYTQEYGLFTPNNLQEIYQKDLMMLDKVYKLTPESLHVVVAEDKAFASYNSAVAHCWPLDPFAKGSYSCIGAGQEISFCHLEKYGAETVKSLFTPIDDTLFFAGEHTTILQDIYGTMEAAVESGERTARMIIN